MAEKKPAVTMPNQDQATVPAGRVRPAPDAGAGRGAPRSRGLWLSFVLLVLAPALLFAAYSALLAADRYSSSSSFVVRSMQSGQGGGDLLESITGSVSTGSTKSDSYIIRRYLESADLVRAIDGEFGMDALYGGGRGDIFQRLRHGASFEEKVEYWRRRARSSYDHTTGILTLEIQGFAPEEAEAVAVFVMDRIRSLINELSHAARETSLAYARGELAEAEGAMRGAQAELKAFRAASGLADLTSSAGHDDQLISELNRQIITERANLDVMQMNVSVPGPNITRLEQRIRALESQREQLLEERGGSGGRVVSAEDMADYESLVLGVEIARTRYVAMLEGMQAARRDAERQQRYLAVFAEPYAADEARYPRRVIDALIAALGLLVAWAIGCFLLQMVRDHRK